MIQVTEVDSRAQGRLPSFKGYRRTNDAGMVRDRGLRKQVKALDPTLEVVWDWGAEKWEIWCVPEGERLPYHVTTVQTKDRSYRELGADILVALQQTMQLGYDNIIKYLDEHNDQILRRKRQEFMDKTANPIDMQIVGVEGRQAILRETAKNLDMDVDKVVPPLSVLQKKLAAAQMMQMQQQGSPPYAPASGGGQQLQNGAPVTDNFSPPAQ